MKKYFLPSALLIIGSLFGVLAFSHTQKEKELLTLARSLRATYSEPKTVAGGRPVRIKIAGIVDTLIESLPIAGGQWGISPDRANYLLQSASPGEKGVVVIYGHNKPWILGNLHSVVVDQTVELFSEDGTVHRYKITDFSVVEPKDTSLLDASDQEELMIYTCTGILDRHRLVVRATPIDP